MSLKHSYTLIAPFYDAFLDAATRGARRRSLSALADAPPLDVLVNGVGTGLDLPHLPPQHRYTGVDLTRAMLRQALPRATALDFRPVQGDAQRQHKGAKRFGRSTRRHLVQVAQIRLDSQPIHVGLQDAHPNLRRLRPRRHINRASQNLRGCRVRAR